MNGFTLRHLKKPIFGRIKLIDQDFFTLMVDSNGYIEPTSYCSAVKTLKALGFERESTGTEDGKSFEIWRLPENRQTQTKDTDSRDQGSD